MKKAKPIGMTLLVAIGIFIALNGLFLGLMFGVFCLPDGRIEEHMLEAQAIFDQEGNYPIGFWKDEASIQDNFTDRIMLETCQNYEGMKVSFNALYSRGYARYWHGYTVFLRPLFILFGYLKIRKILTAVHLGMFLISLILIQRRLGMRVSIPYAITWIAFYGFSANSIQYFTSYFVMFLGVILVTLFYRGNTKRNRLLYLFLILGSLVGFIDLLTFPLITFTMPVIMVLLIDIFERKQEGKKTLLDILVSGPAWLIGYGGTWAMKWGFAKWIIGSNVLRDALEQAKFRMNGDDNFVLDRKLVLTANIEIPMLLKCFLMSAIPWAVLLFAIAVQRKWEMVLRSVFLLIPAILPYIWYELLCNHSQQHIFFTYRAQMGTLFVFLIFVTFSLAPFEPKWETIFPRKNKAETDGKNE